MKKKINVIEQLLVSGELAGSVVDSLNYMVQFTKGQDIYIAQLQNQVQAKQADMMEMKEFMVGKDMYQDYLEFRKHKAIEHREKMNEMLKAAQDQGGNINVKKTEKEDEAAGTDLESGTNSKDIPGE